MASCFYNLNRRTRAIGKTRVVPKTSKTTTVWFLASNSKTMPLAMKCQINNVKARSSPTQTWIALGKLVVTYNFATSPFLHYNSSTQDQFRRCHLVTSCPKVVYSSCAFAVLKWAKLQAQLVRTVVAPSQYNFNSGTPANGKTRMVPKVGKTTTVWFLASNSKDMPLAMKCQINNEKKQSFPNKTQNWIAFGSLVVTYNLAASLFCTTQSPFRINLDDVIW